ncbi:diguanylate cyclase/phosphodiesterase with Chase sensor [Chondrocystis sp. NIES-4102]|nr:diguanylate cyclase/phosphodiesterase with Chase sensor [Chondrocystis sp. NIES-4102]
MIQKNKKTAYKKVKKIIDSHTFSLLLLTVFISLIILGIRRLSGLQTLELLAYDWLVNLKSQNHTDPRLLVVEITDKDIEQQNSWPIADQTMAQLLQKIQQHQPKVIGFDLYREVGYPPGTAALKQELQKDNLVIIKLIGDGENSVSAPSGIINDHVGFNDVVVDVDEVLRRNLMYVKLGENKDQELYSFALRLSLKYLAGRGFDFQVNERSLQIGNKVFPDLQINSGGYQLEPSETAGWQILINYRSPNIAKKVTLTQVLAGNVDPNLIKDKIVLIGTSAPSIKDILPTPYRGSQTYMPGVIAHSQMVSQILNTVLDEQPLIWYWAEWVENLWIWGWSLLGVVIAWKLKHPLSVVIIDIISLAGLWIISLIIFYFGGWIPTIPSALTLLITSGSVMGYKALYNLFYDALTGLPNRSLFAQQLKKLQRRKLFNSQEFIAILCLDLDRFKLINDGLGYQAGDRILLETVQRLQSHLDPEAILARVGADEFAIAFKTGEDSTEAIEVANKLNKELAIPFQLQEQNIFTSASIGLALNRVSDNLQPEELLQASHTAMYEAKAAGKSRHEVYATKMHEQAFKRLQLEADLNQAIINQEFELYYQPIICLTTGKIAGFEALVRWQSPSRGFISPGAFIPVAEETGLIVPMGEWILTTACNQMHQWQQKFSEAEGVTMSVNLSSRQFSQVNLVEQIQQTLVTTGLNPASLKLEITESMVMDDVEKTIILLNQLKQLNIKISMDDFGTGFSSFSYLHRFPTDTLKVDRSFVSNMSLGNKNLEIVSTIVILGHKLGMDVIAEGIETPEERKILTDLNCEYGQGYYFAKPLSQEDATKLFVDHVHW